MARLPSGASGATLVGNGALAAVAAAVEGSARLFGCTITKLALSY
jgi:hypothetical protein